MKDQGLNGSDSGLCHICITHFHPYFKAETFAELILIVHFCDTQMLSNNYDHQTRWNEK